MHPGLANLGFRVRKEGRDRSGSARVLVKMPRTPKTDSTVREPDGDGLPVIRPDAAAIDLASEVHWVCAPNVDRTGRDVEKFGATTPALERMAEWLKERKVKSVAMESTGVPRNWNETRLPVEIGRAHV